MEAHINHINGQMLVDFIGGEDGKWTNLVGAALTHIRYGDGKIERVETRPDMPPLLDIRFQTSEIKSFPANVFSLGSFVSVSPPIHIVQAIQTENARRMAIKEAEEAGLSEFRSLAKRYNISIERVQFSLLLPILSKIDERATINDDEIEWLKRQRLFNLLATYHYRQFKRSRDLWDLVKVCSYLRDAGQPDKALDVSSSAASATITSKRAESALMTTRGGAMRDIGNFDTAIAEARTALTLASNSYHPHNLLGAIFYAKAQPAEGDRHFEIALELGSNPKTKDMEIRSVLDNLTEEGQSKIAEYLLQKDAEKYSWARRYIGTRRLV